MSKTFFTDELQSIKYNIYERIRSIDSAIVNLM